MRFRVDNKYFTMSKLLILFLIFALVGQISLAKPKDCVKNGKIVKCPPRPPTTRRPLMFHAYRG
nr:venom polypeptide precursor [Doratifera vulnerans]